MKVGDLVRVVSGSGYYEDGEPEPCNWPESKDQVSMILEIKYRNFVWPSHTARVTTAVVDILGEIAEFKTDGLAIVSPV
jgi:hypothetical protein